MPKIKNKDISILILLFSIFALIAAYFIQYILGHEPCNLCLIERIPYILTIIIISLSFVFKKFEKFFLSIIAVAAGFKVATGVAGEIAEAEPEAVQPAHPTLIWKLIISNLR